jgi:hypothetical protein
MEHPVTIIWFERCYLAAVGLRIVSAQLMLTDTVLAGNNAAGIFAKGATAVGRVGGSTITGNNISVQITGGASLFTYGDNRVDGNTTNAAFTLPVIAEH